MKVSEIPICTGMTFLKAPQSNLLTAEHFGFRQNRRTKMPPINTAVQTSNFVQGDFTMKMKKILTLPLAGSLLLIFSSPAVFANDVISIPATAMLPKDHNVEYSTNGTYIGVPPGKSGAFMAPLVLPQGAVITKVTMEAYDNHGGQFGGYVRGILNEYRYGTVAASIATFDTGGPDAPGDTRLSSGNLNYQVDNSEFSYGFSVDMNNVTGMGWEQLFYKFIVEYELTQLRVVRP